MKKLSLLALIIIFLGCSQAYPEKIELPFLTDGLCVLPPYANEFSAPYIDESKIENLLKNKINQHLQNISYQKNDEGQFGLVFFDKNRNFYTIKTNGKCLLSGSNSIDFNNNQGVCISIHSKIIEIH